MQVPDENSSSKISSPRKLGDKSLPESNSASLDSVINKLKEKHNINEYTKKVINEDLSDVNEENSKIIHHNKAHDLLVEQIGSNNVAVFQTLVNSVSGKDISKEDNMKSQVSVIFISLFLIKNNINIQRIFVLISLFETIYSYVCKRNGLIYFFPINIGERSKRFFLCMYEKRFCIECLFYHLPSIKSTENNCYSSKI